MDASELQKALNKLLGARLNVDGDAGPITTEAVRKFQARNGLKVDGIVGPKTSTALEASLMARSRLLWGSAVAFGSLGFIVWVLFNWNVLWP